MFEEVRAGAAEAKANGLAVVIWAYPRGGTLGRVAETALDVVAYGVHIAALLGAHIIKVKPPTAHIEDRVAAVAYEATGVDYSALKQRVAHVMQAGFDGRRIVIFSGGPARDDDAVLTEVRAIRDGGGHGSIMGRNAFQRPRDEALHLLAQICAVHRNEDA